MHERKISVNGADLWMAEPGVGSPLVLCTGRSYIKHPLLLRRISELRVPVLALHGSKNIRLSRTLQGRPGSRAPSTILETQLGFE
jgi:hypothetical protein